MRHPLIGITSDYNDKQTEYALPYWYCDAVEKAGGVPMVLAYRTDASLIPQIVDALDGVIFSGGCDLHPQSYGQEYQPDTEPIDPARERFERALLAEVEKRRKPALGICLGSQLMNIHRGGSLHQFLPRVARPEPMEHRRMGDWKRRHPVRIEPGTTLAEHLGKRELMVNTSHKQAVNKPGRGLRVIATSPDGVIEGVEDPTFPLFLGVQWHPERMNEEPDQLALFQLLVEKSKKM